jgi:hypothetical protein
MVRTMVTFLVVILFGVSMLSLAVIASEPPQRMKTRKEEHNQIPLPELDFVSITLAASLGMVVVLKLVM